MNKKRILVIDDDPDQRPERLEPGPYPVPEPEQVPEPLEEIEDRPEGHRIGAVAHKAQAILIDLQVVDHLVAFLHAEMVTNRDDRHGGSFRGQPAGFGAGGGEEWIFPRIFDDLYPRA